MAIKKKKIVDDTIITEDKGYDRLYEVLAPTLRLRSHDSGQVVLEHLHKRGYWSFAGYFPSYHYIEGIYGAYKRCKEWSYRKRDIPVAFKAMLDKWDCVWSHVPEGYRFSNLEMKIKEMKRHERQKASKAYKAPKTKEQGSGD